jgi:hypothetical protein
MMICLISEAGCKMQHPQPVIFSSGCLSLFLALAFKKLLTLYILFRSALIKKYCIQLASMQHPDGAARRLPSNGLLVAGGTKTTFA